MCVPVWNTWVGGYHKWKPERSIVQIVNDNRRFRKAMREWKAVRPYYRLDNGKVLVFEKIRYDVMVDDYSIGSVLKLPNGEWKFLSHPDNTEDYDGIDDFVLVGRLEEVKASIITVVNARLAGEI